jgi:hypothetical protein
MTTNLKVMGVLWLLAIISLGIAFQYGSEVSLVLYVLFYLGGLCFT